MACVVIKARIIPADSSAKNFIKGEFGLVETNLGKDIQIMQDISIANDKPEISKIPAIFVNAVGG